MTTIPKLLDTTCYKVEFDADTHTYLVNGKRWDSVTQIMKHLGISCYDFCPEDACFRGDQIHKATVYIDENRLDMSTVPEDWKGYIVAYRKFKDEHSAWRVVMSEQLIINPLQQYAGTMDRLFFDGHSYVVLDIKTGSVPDWTRYQLAAYANCFLTPASLHRIGLQLKPNGTYSIVSFPDISDILDWSCLVRTFQIKKGMGHYNE